MGPFPLHKRSPIGGRDGNSQEFILIKKYFGGFLVKNEGGGIALNLLISTRYLPLSKYFC